MSTMIVLSVTGGSGSMQQVRLLDVDVGAYPFHFQDENLGPGNYRGRPFVNGVLVVEDAFTAVSLVTALAADVTFTVATAAGTGTILIPGLRCDGYRALIADGTQGGQVVGYAVSFVGTLGTAVTSGTAATHAQS